LKHIREASGIKRKVNWRRNNFETMDVKVLFFGVLAEVTGTSFLYFSGVRTLSDLRQRITDRHPEIVHYNFRIAVNSLFTDDDCALSDGDEVALLPPFAGG